MSLIRNIKTALSILLTITLLLLCTACDLSGETGQVNPQYLTDLTNLRLSTLRRPSTVEFIEAGNEWQELFDSATAIESYLRSVLSDSEHGGYLYLLGLGEDAFNKAIQSYTGKRCKFIIEDGKWSLEDMNNFAEVLKSIKLEPKETLLVYTSEESNCIAANISKEGEDRLKNEISALMNNYSIPDDCVWIWTLGGAGENPVT